MITLTIPGQPPRKNRRHCYTVGRGPGGRPIVRVRNSSEFGDFIERMRAAWGDRPPIREGLWSISVTTTWPRWRDLGDCRTPFGDIDATASAVLDALQAIKALDDDVRIFEARLQKKHGDPMTTVQLHRWDR